MPACSSCTVTTPAAATARYTRSARRRSTPLAPRPTSTASGNQVSSPYSPAKPAYPTAATAMTHCIRDSYCVKKTHLTNSSAMAPPVSTSRARWLKVGSVLWMEELNTSESSSSMASAVQNSRCPQAARRAASLCRVCRFISRRTASFPAFLDLRPGRCQAGWLYVLYHGGAKMKSPAPFGRIWPAGTTCGDALYFL